METTTTMTENTSSNSSNSSQHEEINSTRQSSKLSLGSSPSVLSADEQLDGEGPLTPTEKIQDSDDDLSALNSILQAGSPGSLSNEEVSEEEEEEEEENDSASPLSSVPDDFPLSRSNSPELEAISNNKKRRKELVDTHMHPIKKSKIDHHQEELIKKRRASRSITANILSSVSLPSSSRPRRRASRQEQKEADDQLMEDEEEEEVSEEEREDEDEEEGDDEEEEEEENNTSGKKESKEEPEENKKEEPLVEDTIDKETTKEEEEEESSADKINNDTPVGLTEDLEGDDLDCQQRHKEALDALTHIEIEFARLRDKMYQEKMSELNEEAIMIANGTHPELVTLMAEIEEKKGKRISSAEAWRRHQHANFRQQFEGFEYQANIHFISQKNALRRNLLSNINNKKWNIEDERTKLNDPARTDKVFPDGREMLVNKREQKEETGELQDIKEAIGFPMAPNPTGLSLQDVDEDLKLLGVIHRP